LITVAAQDGDGLPSQGVADERLLQALEIKHAAANEKRTLNMDCARHSFKIRPMDGANDFTDWR